MAERQWTPQQEQSITATGGTLLVSAAAGSGKTAVLVERVIRLITAEENPVDVDRLLIVTFTRAAAAEMRQRLGAALAKKAAEQPENLTYQRQQMLLPQAQISTIHGFCAALLREHAARAGLPPHFRVAEEAESILLQEDALDAVLEQSYTAKEPGFMALAAQLSGKKNDETLRQAVRQAYTFMQAQPFPERWLSQQLEAYTAVCPAEKTRWMQAISREMALTLDCCTVWE
ncbi:MAG: helicase-exonuclease AddAB subunit AddA, partial [Ruminococcaceae bacterium]|nr:helicase-exonuclease AddAB subunit AddA [Oscillospiraceae bacterium]